MIVIFDRAHGKDVAGKRSPDSRLIEWEWSQLFITLLMSKLSNYDVFNICPFIHTDIEPGLSNRVFTYNALVGKYGDCLVVSPHVNAASNSGWSTAHGFEVWTSPGQDDSDKIADIFLNEIRRTFSDIKIRTDFVDGDQDKEARFTVLYGYKFKEHDFVPAKYKAVLIENLFMDNKDEVDKLLDPEFNDKLADAYVRAILKLVRA